MIGEPRFDYDEISSTNDVARAAILSGVEEGAVFVAVHQTAGRGRRGASWNAAPGDSVLYTAVAYPHGKIDTAWRLGWLACVAVIQALKVYGISAACKWPNDVVVGSKKIAGILIETVTVPGKGYGAMIGVGINVAQSSFDGGKSYRIQPTSISIERMDSVVTVEDVIGELNKSLTRLYQKDGDNWDALASIYNDLVILGGVQSGIDPVTGSLITGILEQVRAQDGAAQLRVDDSHFTYVLPELGGETNNRAI